MSTSVYLSAIKPPDETWTKHKAVWDACEAAGLRPPEATVDYFNDEPPEPEGVAIDMGSIEHPRHPAARTFEERDRSCSGVLIDLTRLPDHTRYIKVRWG